MLMKDTEQYIKLLDQCAENCKEKYCFFKTLALEKNTNPRLLCQVKCVEIFKWEKSVQAHDDIGWKKAWDLWVEEGYATAFEQAYKENENDLSIRNVYKATEKLVKEKNSNTVNTGVTNIQAGSDQVSQTITNSNISNPDLLSHGANCQPE